MNITELGIKVEVQGLYDGICFIYYPDSDEFVWREFLETTLTKEQRLEHEKSFKNTYTNDIRKAEEAYYEKTRD